MCKDHHLNMCLLTVLFILFFGAHQISAEDIEDVPTWPSAYITRGTLRTPCAEINEPFGAWYDKKAGSSRIDYYNGTVKTFQLSKVGKYGTYFKLEPVLTKISCFKTEGTPEKKVLPQSVLPDMTGYKLIGEAVINGIKTEQWELQSQSNTVFTMYLYWKKQASTKVIVPVRFEQRGPDHRYMDFEIFAAISPPADTFKIENVDSCKPLTEAYFDGLTRQVVYSFNPIQEYVNNNTDYVDISWQNYKNAFNKKYDEAEDSQRKNIFRQKMSFITSTNRANLSYSLGLNHLTDYTSEELNALTSCITNNPHFNNEDIFQDFENDTVDDFEVPASWNWEDLGAVNPVESQGSCGSCWSFSATGAVEGAYFAKTKRLVKLSEQVLMDCTWDYQNKGCDGGYMSHCFDWAIANKGIPLERAYGKYRGSPNFCSLKKSMKRVKISKYNTIKKNCPECIKQHLVKYGPITASVYANKAFHSYASGVFNDNKCSNTVNHAVLIVGYGKLQGRQYWRVKNSWGYKWGDAGYILMDMKSNPCRIMDYNLSVVI